jgi:hypothetical protein
MNMQRSRRLGALLSVAFTASLVASCSSGSTSAQPGPSTVTTSAPAPSSTRPPAPALPRVSPFVRLSGPIELPKGEPGTLAVIAVGPLESEGASNSTVVPVIVRNNTSHAVYNVRAHAVASVRAATVNTGDSSGFAPFAVRRGEWAFGWLLFAPQLPANAHLEISAAGSPKPPTNGRHVDLDVASLVRKQGLSFAGTVSNPTTEPLSAPLRVWLACFDGSTPADVFVVDDMSLAARTLASNQTAPFSADMTAFTSGTCATYALAAQE